MERGEMEIGGSRRRDTWSRVDSVFYSAPTNLLKEIHPINFEFSVLD